MLCKNLEDSQIFLLLRAFRPRQWVKNLAVFAALIFGGFLLNFNYLVLSLKSFFVFCLLSSAAYLINDLADFESDRLHPFKRQRPIASDKLNKWLALSAAILSLTTAFIFSFFTLKKLFIMAFLFTLIQISYTFIFKKIPVIDALVIAGEEELNWLFWQPIKKFLLPKRGLHSLVIRLLSLIFI